MTLEERYNAASENTYVGRVRTTQAAITTAGPGVDFMDAGSGGRPPDSLQSNFQRRAAENITVIQGGSETATYEQTELKGLSRWFGRALNYAFTDPNAPKSHIKTSVWNTFKSLRPDTRDRWGTGSDAQLYFHRWTPTTGFNSSSSLSSLAKSRATGKGPVTT
jgi:hypothetical protein